MKRDARFQTPRVKAKRVTNNDSKRKTSIFLKSKVVHETENGKRKPKVIAPFFIELLFSPYKTSILLKSSTQNTLFFF